MRLDKQSRGRDHESRDEGGQTRKQHEVAQEHTHTRPLTFAAWPPSGIQKVDYGKRSGLEGIVSKRLRSPYRSGRSRRWVKSKNPKHPAVKREAEEDWKARVRRL
jgi:ATP-dependent DNA ligase